MFLESLAGPVSIDGIRAQHPRVVVEHPRKQDYDSSLWKKMKGQTFFRFAETVCGKSGSWQVTLSPTQSLLFVQFSCAIGKRARSSFLVAQEMLELFIEANNGVRRMKKALQERTMVDWPSFAAQRFPSDGHPYDRYLEIGGAVWNDSHVSSYCFAGSRVPDSISFEYREQRR